ILGPVSTGLALLVTSILTHAAEPCPPPAFSAGGSAVATSCSPPTIGSAPAWFVNAVDGQWTTVAGASNQTIKSVLPNPVPTNAGSHPGNIVAAWTGAGVDQNRGEYMLVANGGHADYPGNEGYALALRSETPAWRRLTDPSPQAQLVFNDTLSAVGPIYLD